MINQPLPPCQAACPIHQDVREYINRISRGNFAGALEIIADTNPMPASLGAICAHPCEEECRRNNVDGSLSIRGLKCFAVSRGGEAILPLKKEIINKKVAVIGSGPAGLAAAHTLAILGYSVTVFDREKAAGGALRNYIPKYRLSDDLIIKDIENLKRLGIAFSLNKEFGVNLSLEELKHAYDAVILSFGLCASRSLNIPGADHISCSLALSFLYSIKHEGYRLKGGNVIVIGGGNVAMDVARSALRAGAETVKLACLESREEMPAFAWEIEAAEAEGVEIFPSAGPVQILTCGDLVTGLKVQGVKAVFDAKGRFNPTYHENSFSVLEGDKVIFAVGQGVDFNCLCNSNIAVDAMNGLVFDAAKMTTTQEAVFACGEMVTGPGTAVKAMADGKKAACAVDAYLKKKEFEPAAADITPALPELVKEVSDKIKPMEREKLELKETETRIQNFDPIELGYSLMQGLKESRRCLKCGLGAEQVLAACAHCLTCLRICPYGVPAIDSDGNVQLREEYCQSCGLCLAACPARTIIFKNPELQEAEAEIKESLSKVKKNGEPLLMVMTCAYAPFAMGWFNRDFYGNIAENIALVKFPCVAKIDTLHMLDAFSEGADAVLITGCAADRELTCPYYDVSYWAEKRVDRVKEILKAININPGKLESVSVAPLNAAAFNKQIADFLQEIKKL